MAVYPGDMRDPTSAAKFVAGMTDEQVVTYATHDPDIFRTVAKELLLYVELAEPFQGKGPA